MHGIERKILVSTDSVLSMSFDKAVVSGKIIDFGEGIKEYGHCWSKSPFPTVDMNKTSFTGMPGKDYYTSEITGLDKGGIYYVRAYAKNNIETEYGNTLIIQAKKAGIPVVKTISVSLENDYIVLKGIVVSSGEGGVIIYKGDCIDTLPNPTINNNITYSIEISPNDSINGCYGIHYLNVTYYLRAYAINEFGIGYGEVLSIKAPPPKEDTIFREKI